MEQPSDAHPGGVRRPPPGRDSGRRDVGVRRDVGPRPQGGAQRLLALLPADILGEPLQAPGHRPEGLQRVGSASHRRLHVQGRNQRRTGTAPEPDQGRGEPAGARPRQPGPLRRGQGVHLHHQPDAHALHVAQRVRKELLRQVNDQSDLDDDPVRASLNINHCSRFPTPGITVRTPGERSSPFSPLSCPSNYEPSVKLPHMSRLSFPESLLPRPECQSPIPRRKQARPRRRSGEMCGPQDLTKPSPPPSDDPAPENLSVKKPVREDRHKEEDKIRTPDPSGSPEIDLSMGSGAKEFRSSPPVSLQPTLNMKQEIDSHSPLPFPPMPSVSALTMTPPQSKCKFLREVFSSLLANH
jgi:hypothetical protein